MKWRWTVGQTEIDLLIDNSATSMMHPKSLEQNRKHIPKILSIKRLPLQTDELNDDHSWSFYSQYHVTLQVACDIYKMLCFFTHLPIMNFKQTLKQVHKLAPKWAPTEKKRRKNPEESLADKKAALNRGSPVSLLPLWPLHLPGWLQLTS